MDNIYYQIKSDNTTAYSKTKRDAEDLQNEIYNKTKKVAKIRPMKKSEISISDWDLVNELSSQISISMRYR